MTILEYQSRPSEETLFKIRTLYRRTYEVELGSTSVHRLHTDGGVVGYEANGRRGEKTRDDHRTALLCCQFGDDASSPKGSRDGDEV
jgi:hypothetical protein